MFHNVKSTTKSLKAKSVPEAFKF